MEVITATVANAVEAQQAHVLAHAHAHTHTHAVRKAVEVQKAKIGVGQPGRRRVAVGDAGDVVLDEGAAADGEEGGEA